MTSEPLTQGWHPDPTGEPGQEYWDGHTWQVTAPSTTAAVRKPETRIKRFAKNAAVILFALIESEVGILIHPFGTDAEDGTDPDGGTDPEDYRD
jgi:hypothetical protein